MRWGWVLVGMAACSSYSSSNDDAPAPNPLPQSKDASADVEVEASASSIVEAGADASVCSQMSFTSIADTTLSSCNGSSSFGSEDFANPKVGLAIFKFHLTADAIAALDAKKVTSATLTLTADPNCSACDSGIKTVAGVLSADAMRTDWEEGTTGARTAPDRCRRVFGNPEIGWGAGSPIPSIVTAIASPADLDGVPAKATFADEAPKVDVVLGREAFSKRPHTDGMVAFAVSVSTGTMIVATHESKTKDPPILVFTLCGDK